MPKADHFGPVDRDCLGLVELPAAERHGLLWVHPQPGGVLDVDTLLGPDLAAELAAWELAGYQAFSNEHHDIGCNWKLAMDTFGETYHFPAIHQRTVNLLFHPNVAAHEPFERNHRFVLCRRTIEDVRRLPEADWQITRAAIAAYWLFPNVQLILGESGVNLVRVYPIPGQPGRHVSRFSHYLRPGVTADTEIEVVPGQFLNQHQVTDLFTQIVLAEDYVRSASQQRTADSGALTHVLFGRNEPALHHYHSTYRAALGLDPLPLLDDAEATA